MPHYTVFYYWWNTQGRRTRGVYECPAKDPDEACSVFRGWIERRCQEWRIIAAIPREEARRRQGRS